jgi:hypothetical protein
MGPRVQPRGPFKNNRNDVSGMGESIFYSMMMAILLPALQVAPKTAQSQESIFLWGTWRVIKK